MLECEYFTSGLCNACLWIDSAYSEQMILKIHATKELLHPAFRTEHPDQLWLDPVTSPRWRYKNKATMTVSGTSDIPILGVLPEGDDVGVDITGCPQFPQDMEFVFAAIQNMVAAAEIQPYQASTSTGELKTIEVTISPANELMLRFVVRTGAALTPLRTYLPILLKPLTKQRLPARVVSVCIEDDDEYALHGKYLTLQFDDVPLQVTATSHFSTNPHVTKYLYQQARAWADGVGANTVWDLFSGVGGLGLSMVRRNTPDPLTLRAVWGVDACEDSVRAANITAHEMGYRDLARFVPGDAARLDRYDVADLAVVTPPTAEGLCALVPQLNTTGPKHLMYRSSHPVQLAEDLVKLNNYVPVSARLFDMYPNTPYAETAVLLQRSER
ncbi:hypothetical protein [Enteractinococcus coprophilus]|uniref:23S rRNA m(5)U-747 methyltransferase n=1 Tax=Enteractinococcus coprophilus TaxID=1027633 RepID=A0A543ANB0_9MICC|nr:hypothetical protein [Enteractinococcus coprophilus]TQL74063.1 23S rRNA m(5)U-747 methyltransferase [Enteractinococcus coprophilus]